MTGNLGVAFRRLWVVTAAANLGDGLLAAGLPVLLVGVTTSPSAAAGLQVALMLPMLLLAVPAGILADRVGPRGVLQVANAIRAGILLVLAVAVGWVGVGVGLVYLAAVMYGAGEVLVDTTAETAVPGVVGRGEVSRAHSRLIATQMVGNNAVGAPVGAVLAAVGGVPALALPGLLFAGAAAVAGRMPRPASLVVEEAEVVGQAEDAGEVEARARLRDEVLLGARIVRRDPLLRRMAGASAAMNLGNSAFFGVLVLLVIGPIGLPASAYGILLAVLAGGGVVGAAIADRVHRLLGYRRTLVLACALTVVGMVVLGTARGPLAAGLGVVLTAVPGMVWNVTTRVVRQVHLPVAVLGRVSSVVRLIALCAAPAGAVIGGAVAEAHGVAAVTWVALVAGIVSLGMLVRIPEALMPALPVDLGDDRAPAPV